MLNLCKILLVNLVVWEMWREGKIVEAMSKFKIIGMYLGKW